MQNLLEELKSTLEIDDRLVIDGKLNKNKIVEMALALDGELLTLLLKNDTIKKHFFKEVSGTLIFDKIEFQRFVSNKQFLPDSYTAFKNKIGLTANGEYLTESKEVVLAWPYKDCVLEGGQTKEDQKRKEIFWNATLAPDEIDRLLDPKVLTNFKRYDKDGESVPNTINPKQDNFIFKGNNLLALHSLQKQFAGKVKLIYIDPPYNTGNDSFGYNDSFNHSTWLTFMYNRLSAAKKLLSKDGVIFVQCDEHEQAHLKILLDGVFGRDNFGNTIIIKTKTAGVSGSHEGKSLQKSNEMIHFYSSDVNYFNFQNLPYTELPFEQYLEYMRDEDKSFKYTTILIEADEGKHYKTIKDGYGNDIEVYKVDHHKTKSISRIAKEEKISEIQAYRKYFDRIFTTENAQTSIRTRVQEATDDENNMYYIEYFPVSGKNKGEKTRVYFVGPKKRLVSWFSNIAVLSKDQLVKKERLGTLWDKINWNNVTREGGVKFPNGQKPEQLLQTIIEATTAEGDIVLDFHLGSGTTAAAAMKLKRQFIGVEQLDYGKNDSTIRLQNVIKGDPTGISKEANWQGGGSFIYAELKQSNATFVEQIEAAKDTGSLWKIWEQMQETGFISYRIQPQTINAEKSSFEELSLEEQKQFLIELLDKNQLYVNYSEIDDETYQVSEEEKKLNREFYRMK